MPEIRHIAFYIIISRKGDDMKQGVFWVIDNNLLAIPFDKSKYTDGIAKSGDTYNHEKLWKYVKPQNCNKPYNYYPRGRVVKGTKSKAIIYMNPNITNEFISSMPDDNIIDLTEKLRAKIVDLNIDVLYIPYLEDLLQNYCTKLQIDALKYFYNFAFDKKISIVSTLSSFDYHECKNDDALFYPQHKLDVPVLKKNLPSEAMYITSFANNIASFDNWSVWDSINDTRQKFQFKALMIFILLIQ